jgi:tRNA nucleotidyltransferase (CCA-adding enzyme)
LADRAKTAALNDRESIAARCSASPAESEGGRWELFAHDADIGVRGWGATAAEAFEQAARALTAVVTHAGVEPRCRVEVTCEAPDLELLLADWLNAIIYEMAVRNMLFGCFTVRIEQERLEGTLWGEPVDVKRHAPACEPKGATYTALRVAQSPGGMWSAACVVDV